MSWSTFQEPVRSNQPMPAEHDSEILETDQRHVVYVVDDDLDIRSSLHTQLTTIDIRVECYSAAETFFTAYSEHADVAQCLLLDLRLPGTSGLELLQSLEGFGARMPTIILTGHADVSSAVESMRAGAFDILQKPVPREILFECVRAALAADAANVANRRQLEEFAARIELLSPREHEVMELLVQALNTKQIAARLDVGFQTAAKHRANVLRKLGVKNEVELVLMTLSAE